MQRKSLTIYERTRFLLIFGIRCEYMGLCSYSTRSQLMIIHQRVFGDLELELELELALG